MDVRSPFFQNIAAVLAGILFLNPIMVAAADATLTAANGATQVGQANNGVPVVNIATPNGSGLSHNKFTDYNVGQQGLILNNATKNLQSTQLGGVILGNPNLQGRAANLILNEVTGGSPSQLRGYTEVAGQQAHVIVANPNGITCNGCGFINTPRATLTTGKPIIEDGRLDRLQVDGGAISIEGQGLNASNVDQFDLITRSAQINAELQANKLNIITGANDVQVADLAVSARAADPADAPQLAIDSSALGGMYAGAIRLVGTEAGVGVRLAGDLAASAGDIQIDANGQLTLARTAASRDLQLAASDVELTADTYAGREAKVSASGQSQVQQSLAAGQRVQVSGGTLDNQGVVEAGVSANGTLNGAGQLVLDGAKVVNRGELVSHGSVAIDTQTLDNHAGKVRSAGNADIVAAQLDNTQGSVIAQGAMTLTSSALDNQSGELLARHGLSVNTASLDNRSGTLAADSIALELSGSLDNSLGLLESSTALEVNAGSLVNANGKLRALGTAGTSSFAIGGQFNNDSGLLEVGNASLSLVSAGLSNQGGTVRHLGAQDFLIDLDDLGNAGGRFFTNAELSLSAAAWHNTSELQAEGLLLAIDQLSQSASGKLISRQSIITSGSDWNNDGAIITDGDLSISLSGDYLGNGSLSTPGALSFQANSATLGSGADWRAGGQGTLQLVGNLSSQGRLTAAGDLRLQLAALDNRGTLGAGQALRIEADSITNRDGLIFSGTDMALRTAQLSNLYADIYSLGALSILASDEGAALDLLDNRSASIESSGDMSLRATVLNNRKDVFQLVDRQTYGHVSIKCYDCGGDKHNVDYIATERFETFFEEDSAAARIHSGGDLDIQGGAIANQYSTLSAQGDITISGTSLENTGASAGTIERVRRYNTGRISDGSDERFRDDYINPYNAQPLPKTLPSRFSRWNLVSDIQTETPGGITAPAIIQAGGDVSISASQPLTNQATLARQAPQNGTEQNPDTTVLQGFTPLVVQLNPQLPADLAQQAVDPLGLPGFTLPQGQNGLFQLNTDPSHRYLVETNPAFASLGGFINSDYMLSQLGYAPDEMQRRLGDGLYEQRLIEQAIAARTGKRFLNGLTSNDAQFRYLMDNAIASKAALNLSVGVALSAEQVVALTHDIVWLEEREVQGQKVLVPVLYLAQAGDRLAPSGALIQGRDVALISGGDLSNSGTLRATANLSVTAGNIGNSGLMQAGERLQLLATDSIRNAQGGIINAKDVSAIALTGDIRNERTITQEQRSGKGYSQLTSVVDSAAAFEAGNSLSLAAGRDLLNIGGTLKAGGNADLSAGGDMVIASAEAENGTMRKDRRHYWNNTSTTQYGSDVQVGGNLSAQADGDLAVIASTVTAGGDVALASGGDTTIAAAANESSREYRYKRSDKKVNKEDSRVRQQAAVIEAGGDLDVVAGGNLVLSASRLKAGQEAYFYAGEQLALTASTNSDYHLYDYKKKGSWGSKKTKRDEVTDVRNVGSSITSGSDLTLVSEGDQLYQRARLESGGDLTLDSGGEITFEAVKDLHQESHEKSSNSWAWTSAEGKGHTDETLQQSQLIAKGDIVIQAVDGLKIDIKEVNQQTVRQTIDAMVSADPGLAWLKEMEERGDVDWRRVKEVHDSYKYSHSGLGGAAAIIIAIIVTYLTWGAGSSLVGAAQGTWQAAAANTVASSVASNAATSAINNRGNLGAVVKDVTSEDALRGYAVAGITAGLTSGLYDGWTGTETGASGALPNSGAVIPNGGLTSLEGIGRFAGNQLLQNGTSTVLDQALGGDSSFSDALRSSLANTFAAAGFNWIGDQTAPDKWDLKDGSLAKITMHAVMGGLAAEAAGGDFKTGALAAGINEALVDTLAQQYAGMTDEERSGLLVMNSQVIGVLAAAAQGGNDEALQIGARVASAATQYNYLIDHEMQNLARDLKDCQAKGTCQQVTDAYFDRHLANEAELRSLCDTNLSACQAKAMEIYIAVQKWQELGYYAELDGQPAKILQAFHQINLAAGPEATQAIALPSAQAFAEALGLNPDNAATKATVVTIASLMAGKASGSKAPGPKGISSVIEPKIAQQMGKRGWTKDSLDSVIASPSKTVVTKDTRFDPVSGTRLNDPATAYIANDGSYVVRNDRTGAIVQVSDRNDKDWVAPWD